MNQTNKDRAVMQLLDIKKRLAGIALYFRLLPTGNAVRALLLHHAFIRHWLARPEVKPVDEWLSAVLFWGPSVGVKLVREYRKEIDTAAIPGFAARVSLRPQCSDRSVFRHIFLYAAYALRSPARQNVKWIIDAGANVGFSALFFAGQYPNAKIVAIEPDAANFKQLIANTRHCDRIKVRRGALWSESTRLGIVDAKANTQAFRVLPKAHGEIEGISLVDLMKSENIQQIDILKMDIEGAEKEIFQNYCEPWLGKVNALLVELHDRECQLYFERAIAPHAFERLASGENVFLVKKSNHAD